MANIYGTLDNEPGKVFTYYLISKRQAEPWHSTVVLHISSDEEHGTHGG